MSSNLQLYKKSAKVQEWSERVRACRESGLSVKGWCEKNGISKHMYYKWQEKIFLAAESAARGPEFAEVIYKPETTQEAIRMFQFYEKCVSSGF